MARKRNIEIEISNITNDPRINISVDRNEVLKLTKVAKSWDFTCSFCFKKFPSAQAMGGHQNAHRLERLEEKRLYVRDPIGYRKRAYLRAMKADSSSTAGGQSLHATAKMEVIDGDPRKALQEKTLIVSVVADHGNYTYNFLKPSSSSGVKDSSSMVINGDTDKPLRTQINGSSTDQNEKKKKKTVRVMNFLPPKELSLAERIVGLHEEDGGKGKVCGYGVNFDRKMDLTLKL